MIGLSYEDIVKKIQKEADLSEIDIEVKIKDKLRKLSDLISKEGAAHIVANELGVKLIDFDFKINKLRAGMNSVNITAKVLNLYGINEYKTDKKQGKVANLLVGDESGIIKFVLWDTNHIKLIEESKLKEGDIIKIRNGYVKNNNTFNELHLGNRGQMQVNPEGVSVSIIGKTRSIDFTRKCISELKAGEIAGVFGTIVQVFEPRFYEACPDCGKKANEGRCDEHGAVTVVDVPILNLFFDDGTDNIRVVAFRNQVERLLNLETNEVLKFKDDVAAFERHKEYLLGKQLVIVGRVNRNDMFDRNEFTAQRIIEVNPEEFINEISLFGKKP